MLKNNIKVFFGVAIVSAIFLNGYVLAVEGPSDDDENLWNVWGVTVAPSQSSGATNNSGSNSSHGTDARAPSNSNQRDVGASSHPDIVSHSKQAAMKARSSSSSGTNSNSTQSSNSNGGANSGASANRNVSNSTGETSSMSDAKRKRAISQSSEKPSSSDSQVPGQNSQESVSPSSDNPQSESSGSESQPSVSSEPPAVSSEKTPKHDESFADPEKDLPEITSSDIILPQVIATNNNVNSGPKNIMIGVLAWVCIITGTVIALYVMLSGRGEVVVDLEQRSKSKRRKGRLLSRRYYR